MSFKGKIVLVTGARRGIGRAVTEMFAMKNATVIGTATSESGANFISSYLGNSGKGVKLDVSSNYAVERFFKKIYKEYKEINILVNNAGITSDNLLIRMKEDQWQSVIDINLNSVFRISKAVIKTMIKNRYGRIISIGSIVGSVGNIGQANYTAAKAGLIGFSKSLAREVASRGITVNVVSPGFIITDMTKILKDEYREKILSHIPSKRFGYPKEIASTVAFFASEEASYITGETIHVNGGMCML